jgi:hypothetical protein
MTKGSLMLPFVICQTRLKSSMRSLYAVVSNVLCDSLMLNVACSL